MDRPKKTKTFNLIDPSDLYFKLIFDIERLRKAKGTRESCYAAFDCAVDSWHLVDWVLHAVDDETHLRLTGLRPKVRPKNNLTIETIFKDQQEDRLPALKYCHIIANSVKHREVRNDDMPQLFTGSTAIFSWSEKLGEGKDREITSIEILTYLNYEGERHPAIDLFEAMASQWKHFLVVEKLYDWRDEFEEDQEHNIMSSGSDFES